MHMVYMCRGMQLHSSLCIVVHGFEHALYTLREGENLTTSFTKEVKGRTVFPFVQLTGLITSEADTAGE